VIHVLLVRKHGVVPPFRLGDGDEGTTSRDGPS